MVTFIKDMTPLNGVLCRKLTCGLFQGHTGVDKTFVFHSLVFFLLNRRKGNLAGGNVGRMEEHDAMVTMVTFASSMVQGKCECRAVGEQVKLEDTTSFF